MSTFFSFVRTAPEIMSWRPLALILVVALGVSIGGPPAVAQTSFYDQAAMSRLIDAQMKFSLGKYFEVVDICIEILENSNVSDQIHARANFQMGTAHVAMKNFVQARRSFNLVTKIPTADLELKLLALKYLERLP